MKLKALLFSVFSVMVSIAPGAVYFAQAQAAPRRIEIAAKRFEFTPANITLKKGEPVVIVLKSIDVAHGLRFRRLGLDLRADKGQTRELPFTPTKTGDFTGQCSVFCGSGHGHMKLTLHVIE
jgi:cytochrome c oxidase subunit II